jgi:hypothetical protein
MDWLDGVGEFEGLARCFPGISERSTGRVLRE